MYALSSNPSTEKKKEVKSSHTQKENLFTGLKV
jgi:hypothetical protein